MDRLHKELDKGYLINHLAIYNKAIFDQDYIALMLGGAKKMGLKFGSRRTAPYQKLLNGDIIYLKESSGPVRGLIQVGKVTNVEIKAPEQIMQFLSGHIDEIGICSESQLMSIYFQNIGRRYLCYWEISRPEILPYPVLIRKSDRRAWVAGYEPSEDVLMGLL